MLVIYNDILQILEQSTANMDYSLILILIIHVKQVKLIIAMDDACVRCAEVRNEISTKTGMFTNYMIQRAVSVIAVIK